MAEQINKQVENISNEEVIVENEENVSIEQNINENNENNEIEEVEEEENVFNQPLPDKTVKEIPVVDETTTETFAIGPTKRHATPAPAWGFPEGQ